ncbi:MAG: ABC transporter ATP-binding protein [Clostridia bacterium]|nr:ABC transporter ATP-binding protein [Clostridia bacterium]
MDEYTPLFTKHLKGFGIPKIIPFLKKYRIPLFFMASLQVAASVLSILFPKFQEYAINNYVTPGITDGIVGFALIYSAVLLVKVALDAVSMYIGTVMEMKIGRDLKQASFNHLQTLSFSYFHRNSVGYILSRVSSDTNRIGTLVSWEFIGLLWNFTYAAGSLVVMFVTNPGLAALVMIIVPVLVVVISVMQKKLLYTNREIREENAKISGGFNEGITGAKTIKTLATGDKMYSEFSAMTGRMKKVSVRDARIRGTITLTLNLAAYIALAVVVKVGGDMAAEQIMTIGTLSMFMTYALGLMEPVRWVIDSLAELTTIQVNIERFFGLLETEPDVKDTAEVIEKYGTILEPKRENWEEITGDIEFENVTFKYPDGEEYVLRDFSLKIPHGTNVAIVGETGAGKSTIVNLVCRFFEPTEGRVLIDGRDARERSQLWLHSNIGYVLQTPHLFSGTIRDNMKYGKPDATDEEIMEALRTVSADEIVTKSKDGLDTEVGEGGELLSTGEKQLISFARAIICDPKLLILDEATSSIDSFTEQIIQDSIKTVIEGRTSFVIAHRLSTVRGADVILVVKDGKIIEQGRHRSLMKQRGYYFDLYTQQYRDEATANYFEGLKAGS